jgi:hypothetical protein
VKFLLVPVLALVLASSSSAVTSQSQTLRTEICPWQPQVLYTKPIPERVNHTHATPFVNGREVETLGVGKINVNGEYNAVEGSSYGVIFRITDLGKNRPLKVRVASVRDNCARFRLVVSWH